MPDERARAPTVTDRLSPLDATFIELEDADPTAHMHIGAVMVFDAAGAGGVPSVTAVRDHLARRLSLMPRFRRRLSHPRSGALSYPAWEDDPAFDVAAHVRRAALPRPGGPAELAEWAAEFWSHRLDRRRPLWEIVLLEGLEGGRWALVTKTHHALADGVGSLDVAHLILDATPDASDPPAPPPDAEATASAPGLVSELAHTARAGLELVRDLPGPRQAVRRSSALAELILRDEVVPAPSTSLNRPTGKARRFAVVRAGLSDLKLVRRRLGGTVNDVALAVVTSGLRALLVHRGEQPPPGGLRAMVPVNVRGGADEPALGNRITSLFVELPVDEPVLLARYGRTVRNAERLKAGDQALGSSTLLGLAGLAPPVLHAVVARSLFATRLFNVTVTNVPGPQSTLYAFGAPLREVAGLVPLAADHDVAVAVLSYDGHVTFGVVADRVSVPDLEVMTDAMRDTLAELVAIARAADRAGARG